MFGKLTPDPTYDFSFSHVDPDDRTRAVFRIVPEQSNSEDVKATVTKHLKSMFEDGNPSHKPQIIVQIRKEANDTLLPGFEPNWDALEIKVNWIGMYSEWFREHKEWIRRFREIVRVTHPHSSHVTV